MNRIYEVNTESDPASDKKMKLFEQNRRNKKYNKVNRSSQVYISDRFLKLQLLIMILFYVLVFTVPSITVIDCV